MKRLLTFPLRVSLPVLLLTGAAVAGLISWQLNSRLLVAEIEAQFLEETKLRVTGLQAILEYHYRKGDSNGVALGVSGMATRNDVISAFVLDEQNRVLASTRSAAIGSDLSAIAPELPNDLESSLLADVAQVRNTKSGKMALSQDGTIAAAYSPLLVDVERHALRSSRNGLLVLVLDMQIAKARAFQAARRQALYNLLVFGGLAACAWMFIHFSLTRRVAALVEATRKLAAGDLGARAQTEGNDELAQVGNAFDLMATRIAADTGKLAESLSLLNATLDSTADGILAVQFTGNVVCSNAKFAAMWGIPQNVLANANDAEIIAFTAAQVTDPERFIARIKEIKANPDTEIFDVLELKNGRVFERYAQPQRIDGRSVGMVINFRDITERKHAEMELESVHKQLMEASRQAGMTEIATNVLHNVGNVLNSVNISASLAEDYLRKSKAASLAKVAALLKEHENDLGNFVTNDPQGKMLPAYLAQLSEFLVANEQSAIQELLSLRENIEHIKVIVAVQQSYASVSGVKEIVDLKELAEDSIRMNINALERHGIELVREFEPVPLLNVDKHKVLQILVNLVQNAKCASDESGRADKRVTIRVKNDGDSVILSVTDNGIGIAPENLSRVFNHGFTTRKDGHGFGLHSGALAAKEMGGALTVHSDGIRLGATFRLRLPIQATEHQST